MIKIWYCTKQLDYAVNFIATHNSNFYYQHNYIRETMLDLAKSLIKRGESYIATMGFTIQIQDEFEENGVKTVEMSFLVDPSLGFRSYSEDEYSSIIVY